MGGRLFGRFLIAPSNFNTVHYFRQIPEDVPVLLIHGDSDTLIPAHHSLQLSEERMNVQVCMHSKQGHNNFDFRRIANDINDNLKIHKLFRIHE